MTFGDSPFVVPERPGRCPLRRTRSAGTASAASIPISQLFSENVFPHQITAGEKGFLSLRLFYF